MSTGVQVLGAALAFLVPETLPLVRSNSSESPDDSAQTGEDSENNAGKAVLDRIAKVARGGMETTKNICRSRNVLLLLFVFFVSTLSKQAMQLLIIYVSKRYQWSIARVCLSLLSSQ